MRRIGLNLLFVIGVAAVLVVAGQLAAQLLEKDPPAPAPPEQAIKPGRKLVIVGEPWAPFEYPENELAKGIDADALKQIMAELNVDYEIQFYPWSRAWLMATSGQADAVISISYKPSREEYLLYSDSQKRFGETGEWPEEYLWSSEYVFFCRKLYRESFTFESYDQIKQDGYRVITIQDYSYNAEFRDADLKSILVPTQEEGYRLLAAGKADIFPNEKTVGSAAVAKLRLENAVSYLPKPLFRKPYLMPFCRKSDYPDKRELMHKIYARLNEMRANGEYEKIRQRYLDR